MSLTLRVHTASSCVEAACLGHTSLQRYKSGIVKAPPTRWHMVLTDQNSASLCGVSAGPVLGMVLRASVWGHTKHGPGAPALCTFTTAKPLCSGLCSPGKEQSLREVPLPDF